jgi:hypothetical protein
MSPSSTVPDAAWTAAATTYCKGFVERWGGDAAEEREQARKELLSLVLLAAGGTAQQVEDCVKGGEAKAGGAGIEAESAAWTALGDALLTARGKGAGEEWAPFPVSPPRGAAGGAPFCRAERARAAYGALWAALVAGGSRDVGVLFKMEEGEAGGAVALVPVASEWLQAMSNSSCRPLRAAAVLGALGLMRGLCAAKDATESGPLAAIHDMHASEVKTLEVLNKRALASATAQTIAARERQRALVASHAAELEALRDAAEHAAASVAALCDGVLTHRYRDAAPATRSDIMEALGGYMADFPATFLQNMYLKYVGWLLNDADAGVRGKAVGALLACYAKLFDWNHGPSFVALTAGTGDFMTRFRGRLAAMAEGDEDAGVRRAAVAVLHRALLSEQITLDEVNAVRNTLLCDHAAVRMEAASFLMDYLPAFPPDGVEAGGEEEGGGGAGGAGGKAAAAAQKAAAAKRKAREQLESLVDLGDSLLSASYAAEDAGEGDILGDGGGGRRAGGDEGGGEPQGRAAAVMAHVASSFWALKGAEVLVDWAAHGELLLSAGGGGGEGELSPRKLALALALLSSCAARASGRCDLTHEPCAVPPLRDPGDPAAAAANSKENRGHPYPPAKPEEARAFAAAASAALAPVLGDALAKYGDVPDAAVLIAKTLLLVDPAAGYGTARGGAALKTTLYALKRAVGQHASPRVLRALASVYAHLAGGGNARAREAVTEAVAAANGAAGEVKKWLNKLGLLRADADAGAAGAARGKARGKAGGRGAGGRGATQTQETQAEDGDMDAEEEGGGWGSSGGGGGGGVPAAAAAAAEEALSAALRRCGALQDALTGVLPPGSAPLLEAPFSPPSALTEALLCLVRARSAGAPAALLQVALDGGGEGGEAGALAALRVPLVEDALSFLVGAAVGAVARGVGAATALRSASPAVEVREAEGAVAQGVAGRDAVLALALPLLCAVHPGSAPEGGWGHSPAGGAPAEGAPLPAPSALAGAYGFPAGAPPAARAALWRLRGAGFSALARIAVACGGGALRWSRAGELAWAPEGVVVGYLNVYCAGALGGREAAEAGGAGGAGALLGLQLLPLAGAGEEEAEAAAAAAEDEEAAAPGAPLGGALSHREIVAAAAEARGVAEGVAEAALLAARAHGTLARLAAASAADPRNEKLGQAVARRAAASINEGGAQGLALVEEHAALLRGAPAFGGAPAGGALPQLLRMQARCLADACKPLCALARAAREAAAGGEEDAGGAARAVAEFSSELLALARVHVAQALGAKAPAAKGAQARLARALEAAFDAFFFRAPDTYAPLAAVLLLSAAYLAPDAARALRAALEERLEEALPADAPLATAAAWWGAISREKKAADAAEFDGVDTAPLRPLVPLAAFLAQLGGAGGERARAGEMAARALRAFVGAPAPAAAAAGGGRARERKARRGEEEEEEEEEAGGGGGGRATPPRAPRRRAAPAGRRKWRRRRRRRRRRTARTRRRKILSAVGKSQRRSRGESPRRQRGGAAAAAAAPAAGGGRPWRWRAGATRTRRWALAAPSGSPPCRSRRRRSTERARGLVVGGCFFGGVSAQRPRVRAERGCGWGAKGVGGKGQGKMRKKKQPLSYAAIRVTHSQTSAKKQPLFFRAYASLLKRQRVRRLSPARRAQGHGHAAHREARGGAPLPHARSQKAQACGHRRRVRPLQRLAAKEH